MAFSILRLISAAAESSSLRLISQKGIFRCPNYCGSRLGGRMMSINSGDSSVDCCSSLASKASPPWLMLPPAWDNNNNMVYKLYSLADNKIVSLNKRCAGKEDESEELESPDDDALIVGSSHGWLALFNERNCDLFLSNPLSGRHIKLPPIHTLPIPQENLRRGQGCVSKVIISCSPLEQECRAMMIFGPVDKLAFCWPGRSSEWTRNGASVYKLCLWIDEDEELEEVGSSELARMYEDLVCTTSQKQVVFFCMTRSDSNDLEGWDVGDPHSPRLDWEDKVMLKRKHERASRSEEESELKEFWCRQLKYLVFAEQSNQLFLVIRHLVEAMGPNGGPYEEDDFDRKYPYKTVAFDVHKIDREGRKLSHMEASLDGLAMFVGLNHSFAMSVAEFSQLKPNSIYFTDDKDNTPPKWNIDSIYGGHDIGIFDYENKTISSCYYPCDVQSFQRIMPPPIWFTPSPR